MDARTEILEHTANIVAAYVARNPVPASELAELISNVSATISALANPAPPADMQPTPAANPKKSVHPAYIVCLEDGRRFKSLKRHLAVKYNLTPEQYREKWNLPRDYPMVSPNYAAERSELARKLGFGRKRQAARARQQKVEQPELTPA
jgi:predicted transcriptional regulator